jgi:TolB-like protein/Flp pilus assembly protein TadD
MNGLENSRPAATYKSDRALFLLLLSAPYRSTRKLKNSAVRPSELSANGGSVSWRRRNLPPAPSGLITVCWRAPIRSASRAETSNLLAATQQGPVKMERRFSTVLAADVVAYSRLMHDDEEATHIRLNVLLASVIYPSIEEHGGRVVKYTGDGFLAEFPDTVEAVRAALKFQNRAAEFAFNAAEDKRIRFRVGINSGEVIVEPHDVFGDVVNIAARLESIAEPDGICIASSVYDQVQGKLAAKFDDLGEQRFQNIARPIQTYALIRGATGERRHSLRNQTVAPHRSILVLPFENFGDDCEGHFVDGVTDSLTTDLSRISDSFVIARNTAFTFKGKAIDAREVGRELNVRYVLKGSVQRDGKRVRVNVQLIDAESGRHIWADRFAKPVIDLFDMQDEIVSRLAQALDAQLVMAEARRAERLSNPDVLDLVFQGIAAAYQGPTSEHLGRARGFFERALKIDPQNVSALIGIASADVTIGAYLLTDDRSARIATAESYATRALSLDPHRALTHRVLGTVYNLTNRSAQALDACELALAIDRNLADAHAVIGMAKYYLGRAAETESHILEAFRLSPRDIFAHRWMHFVANAKMQLGEYAEAALWARRSVAANRNSPLSHFLLAAALSCQGLVDEARNAAAAGIALNPGFTIRRLLASQPSDNAEFLTGRERIYAGMRLAGVPEGKVST